MPCRRRLNEAKKIKDLEGLIFNLFWDYMKNKIEKER